MQTLAKIWKKISEGVMGNGRQRSKLMQQQMTEVGSMMYLRQELPKSSKATVKPTSYCILSMETCFKWLSITH